MRFSGRVTTGGGFCEHNARSLILPALRASLLASRRLLGRLRLGSLLRDSSLLRGSLGSLRLFLRLA